MKNKVAIAVSTALMSMSMGASASQLSEGSIYKALSATKVAVDKSSAQQNVVSRFSAKFVEEPNLAHGVYTYIVRLKDQPLATYDGSIEGFSATAPQVAKKDLFEGLVKSKKSSEQIRKELRLDVNSKAAKAYMGFLDSKQDSFLNKASSVVGNQLDVLYKYNKAFNGMAVRLTPAEAKRLSQFSDVAYIERERMETLDTDTGPTHVGAPQVWSGEGQDAVNMGEGVIIGVIDSGINSDHPSFADVGGDGYDHTNPWGAGVYVGDCAGDFAELCNDKLIGIRSYASVVDNYDDTTVFGSTPPAKNGEDYGGHGSHTASTAGGNILNNVPLVSPEAGVAESDGIVNESITFNQMSGVAPHANIVAYQICNPGDRGDTYTGCPGAAILAALDDAVSDGVDVINYSISGGGNPWRSSTELGFLAAQQAGIFAAASAGNDGPDPATTAKNAPWYTAVGASTHSRAVDAFVGFNGESYAFTNGSGPALTDTITASPVSSVNVDADNFEGCDPFPADSFENSIALISRGACAFSDKVTNATNAGATAVIVYNNRDFTDRLTMSGLENTTIPAVFISQNSGTQLLADLAGNSDEDLSIDPTVLVRQVQADNMASFSSRGPNNTVPDIMTPSVTAPGVAVYAAYSDQQFGHDVTGTAPSDYNFLSGTSMSAPHVAGAGAVLKSAHPTWTPDNIRSALMLTAIQDVRKEDGSTAADPFDMGSGSIRVNQAHNTGLIMDETFANYIKANPAVAGIPSSLNVPSMAASQCVDTCSWERTFTATTDASWTVKANAPENVTLTVSPESFDIEAGATQTITVTADVSDLENTVWNFGDVVLTAEGKPNARLPVLVKKATSNLPTDLSISSNRAAGSITYKGLKAEGLTNATATTYESKPIIEPRTVQVPDGSLGFFTHTFTEDQPHVIVSMSSDEAPDADLRILNSSFQRVGASAGASSNESVTLLNLPADTYFIVADAFTASAPGATDDVVINILTTELEEDSVSENVTATVTSGSNGFDLALNWNGVTNAGGLIQLKEGDASALIPWSISLGEADVSAKVSDDLATSLQTMTPGVAQAVAFEVLPNFTNEDKVYTFTAELSANHEAVNINNGGTVDGSTVTWNITRAAGQSTTPLSVGFDMLPRKSGTDFTLKLSNTLGNDTLTNEYTFGVVEAGPTANVSNNVNIREGDSATFDGTVSTDPNNDQLTYEWVQVAGPSVSFERNAGSISFTAPEIEGESQVISFELTVTDPAGNSDTTISSSNIVQANRGSGGSFGWLLLLGLPLLALRRKLR